MRPTVASVGGLIAFARVAPERITRRGEQLLLEGAERALEIVLRSPLVDAFARDVVRYRVIQRVADPVVEGEAIDDVGPALVAHVIESGVVDEVVDRLLQSEQFWLLIDEIACSPAVADAISHQGAGFADQMADVVRDRSRNADARLERIARRMFGRGARPIEGATPAVAEP
jgi:hypothetical protein